MRSSSAIFLGAVLLHGVSCYLFPQALLNLNSNGALELSPTELHRGKRQANVEEAVAGILHCISEKLDATFAGNNSRFVSDCKSAATVELEMDSLDDLVSQVNSIYDSLCVRECGDVILKAYRDCGYFDVVFPGTEEFTIAMCGTNDNGNMCYKLYGKGLALTTHESLCYVGYTSQGKCNCQSELSDAVEQQGCCINAYHKLNNGLGLLAYNPDDLYNDICKVSLPKSGCNNSPLRASSSMPRG